MAIVYKLQVTGDCQNLGTGAYGISFSGGVQPYTVQFTNPVGITQTVNENVVIFKTNLFSGINQLIVNDSTLPTNDVLNINIPISSGICCSILGVQNTTCGLNNGSVTGTSNTLYSSTNYYVYSGDGSFVTSASTGLSSVVFQNLTAGTYYMTVLDLGGCTGKSQDFIVQTSEQTNFGLYSIPNSSCGGVPIGKVVITGLTGQGPFTYLWTNGGTGSTITGLTEGTYSVEVTDGFGCKTTETTTVTKVDPIGLGVFTVTNPTCLQSDGSVTLTITGGTAPYYYSASTGNVLVSYSQSYTLSGLSSGNYSFLITDAGFCSTVLSTTLQTPLGMTSVEVVGTPSYCSATNGSINVSVFGGEAPFTYTLIDSYASQSAVTTSFQNYLFESLSADTYSVFVEDSSGCEFSKNITILASDKFLIETSVTGTTCNQNNGSVNIKVSEGYTLPLDYSVDGLQNVVDTNLSSVTFNNLTFGNHNVTVTDATGCQLSQTIFLPKGDNLDFSLYSVNCGGGNDGQITAFITSGTPPFQFNWSNNVAGNPQQIEVYNLTAGTYSLTIVDDTGCSLTRNTTISCNTNYTSYQTYVMAQETFEIQSPTKLGLLQMLNEGYSDLTSDNTNCDLISAVFTANVNVNPVGISASSTFFTATTLNNPPSENLWYNTIQSLLLSIPGIQSVTINQINNQITIATDPSSSLSGQEIVLELAIVYDIICLT